MNTKIKRCLCALAITPLLFSSCSESFLEEINPNLPTPVTFWQNEEDVSRGLATCYHLIRRMEDGYYGSFQGALHLQMRADDTWASRLEDAATWENLSFINTPTTGNVCWGEMYKGIQYTNSVIYYAPNANMDETVRSQILGEAHFLRGFYYFQIAKNYEQGVLRTLPQEIDPEYHGLSSYEDLMKQVISDFTEAKKRLPDTRPEAENGRITKGAAIAFLGKAYLWTKDYATAKAEFETIMQAPYTYDLMEDYENNFRDDHEFNKESIWELNYADFGDVGEFWGNGDGTNGYMGNMLAHYFGPCLDSEVTGISGGWYKMQPSPFLIKQFTSEPRPSGSDSKWDKRLYTTCFFKYSDYGDVKEDEKFYGGVVDFDRDMWPAIGREKFKNGVPAYPDVEGVEGRFVFKKFSCWWSKSGCYSYNNPEVRVNNYRVMRFAEVLFLHAETCLQTGDPVGAMRDINRIRIRAGLPEKQLGDTNAIWEELRNQKLLEFAGENLRWYDLIRWYEFDQLKSLLLARKVDQKAADGTVFDGQNYNGMQKKHMYYPIPKGEVDTNTALEQKAEWQ